MKKQTVTYYSSYEEGPFNCADYDEAYIEFVEDNDNYNAARTKDLSKDFLEEHPSIELFLCDFNKYPASRYLISEQIDQFIENANQQAYDQTQIEDLDWLNGLTDEQKAELNASLGKAFDEWATKHNLHPKFSECTGMGDSIWVKPIASTAYEILEKPKQD